MSEHTPAPWHYQEGSDKYTHIVRTGEISRDNPHVGRRFLCQLSQQGDGESEANARLIAAAPDLLAAARKFEEADAFHIDCPECEGEELPETCGHCFPLYDDARVMRRNAIAKATGAAP